MPVPATVPFAADLPGPEARSPSCSFWQQPPFCARQTQTFHIKINQFLEPWLDFIYLAVIYIG
jgi:hypothetical protein